ncbi:unnamed protein product [Cylicocyclus nassatus]|uniref:Uncharacterized protein n=1 Tax=Cylicocyclus nassatus TaxID=53992 RepID=A0AA36GMY1_CYLNA|nr:unnamed protein product [Cylicocyclus nassatus]
MHGYKKALKMLCSCAQFGWLQVHTATKSRVAVYRIQICWADYGNLARITAQNVKERVWEHAKKSTLRIVLDTNATAKARMFQNQQIPWTWLHVNWDCNEKDAVWRVHM